MSTLMKELYQLESWLGTYEERLNSLEQLFSYKPYKKQKSFHHAGKRHSQRLLLAGNQVGKSYAGAVELAYHLTGYYPSWWQGVVWKNPVKAWVGGTSYAALRETVQKLLVGDTLLLKEEKVSEKRDNKHLNHQGILPKDSIAQWTLQRGTALALEKIWVRHASGGLSQLVFKSYEQGRQQWQGASLDMVWFDEEPPMEIYKEGLTRINATQGRLYLTFTPLMGMTPLVSLFFQESLEVKEKGVGHETNNVAKKHNENESI